MDTLSLMEQILFCTTRIETSDKNGNNYSGTGFFFSFKLDETTTIPLIITNKHVVKRMSEGRFLFTVADKDGNPEYKNHHAIEFFNFEEAWIFHPDDNVDLCVLPLANVLRAAKSHGISLFYKTFTDDMIPNSKVLATIDAMEDIIMIGYPNGLWDSVNNMPILRKGITATNIKYDYNGKKEFVIDAACFPGSSGSPVIMCNLGEYKDKQGTIHYGATRVLLLGVLYAGPQMSISGEVKVISVPTANQKVISQSCIPNNLGFVIKAECINGFRSILEGYLKPTE